MLFFCFFLSLVSKRVRVACCCRRFVCFLFFFSLLFIQQWIPLHFVGFALFSLTINYSSADSSILIPSKSLVCHYFNEKLWNKKRYQFLLFHYHRGKCVCSYFWKCRMRICMLCIYFWYQNSIECVCLCFWVFKQRIASGKRVLFDSDRMHFDYNCIKHIGISWPLMCYYSSSTAHTHQTLEMLLMIFSFIWLVFIPIVYDFFHFSHNLQHYAFLHKSSILWYAMSVLPIELCACYT